jgi:pyruvate kinase
MDLGGPKIRTGAMQQGPKVTRLRPERDQLGRVVRQPKVWLGASDPHAGLADGHSFLPVPLEWCKRLRVGSTISLRDARHKSCELTATATERDGVWASCNTSAYVTTGTTLQAHGDQLGPDESETVVGDLAPLPQAIVLSEGDKLVLTGDSEPGAPAELDTQGVAVNPAFVSCTLPEVLSQVTVGDPVSFDDGRIEGVVEGTASDRLTIRITYARGGAAKLRPDKGINLPRTALTLSGLTQKDRQDLKFVAQHADIVNLSFVNRPEDVDDLVFELESLGAAEIGIILKIETLAGFHRLPEILLCALRCHPIGVMLARGDLAVEAGWKRLPQVQQEIMRICQAAHVPLVWATQVLESLAKKGLPSRAEITDLVMAERADCVMLNKGPHILKTIRFLDEIMRSMEPYQEDKAPALPSLDLTEDWTKFSYAWPVPAAGKADKKEK